MEIKRLRQQTGLSQARFALAFGIPKRTIENWESGVSTPATYLVKLIEFAITHGYLNN